MCSREERIFLKWQMFGIKPPWPGVFQVGCVSSYIFNVLLNTIIQNLPYKDWKSWKISEPYEYSRKINLVVYIWFFYYMFLSQAGLYSVLPDHSISGATRNCFLLSPQAVWYGTVDPCFPSLSSLRPWVLLKWFKISKHWFVIVTFGSVVIKEKLSHMLSNFKYIADHWYANLNCKVNLFLCFTQ